MRRIHAFGWTETGSVRSANEDHILVGRFIKNRGGIAKTMDEDDDFLAMYGLIFAVADGIGGAEGGATASRLGLGAFDSQFYGTEKGREPLAASEAALRAAGERANASLLKVAANRASWAGMGCTLAGICLTSSGGLVFHAGDSRVYRFRNGLLKQLTVDDSIVNLAVESGRMTVREAEQSAARHTITNCLGSESFRLRTAPVPEIRDNDAFLVCSDGLHDVVTNEAMERTMAAGATVETMARGLAAEALERGGHDNISAIVVKWDLMV